MKLNFRIFALIFCIFFMLQLTDCQQIQGETLNELFDSYFREVIKYDPELASQLGLTAAMGYPIANDKLTELTEASVTRDYERFRNYQQRLKQIDQTKLTPAQKAMAQAFGYFLDLNLQSEPFKYHGYLINHMFGFHASFTMLMTSFHTIANQKDAEDYISRLSQAGKKLEQIRQLLKIREEKGLIPPQGIIESVANEMAQYVSMPATANELYTSFENRVNELKGLEESGKVKLLQDAERQVNRVVYPAYQSFVVYLNELKQKASPVIGYWKLPDGDAFYAYSLKFHTTTQLSPAEIHEIGKKEVRRLQDEIRALIAGFGIKEGNTFGEFKNNYYDWLTTESGLNVTYPENEESRQQIVADYQKIVDDTIPKLPQLFSVIPKAPVIVEAVPKNRENFMGTSYQPASFDNTRPGIFYINLRSRLIKPSMQSLTYHEAIPGHHFQIALESELQEFKMIRSLFSFTAFIEGWAMYAENLAYEEGWFTDVHNQISYLSSELFRAVRLVVDTGIHYQRWTRDDAFNYMVDNMGWGSYGEIDRYTVWPGQACSYQIGSLKIRELKARAKNELGPKFNLKEFHNQVLPYGSLPLDMLEQTVNDHIKHNK